jgi:serine/threonine protein kinase
MSNGFRIGKFEVLGELGRGAHSTILHVRRGEDRKAYALKIVRVDMPEHRKFLDQGRHEFRIGQMLDHPNLVKIIALEEEKDWLFRVRKAQLLIEYVDGKTLDVLSPVPVRMLVPVFAQVAAGLVHMHRRGVMHADLKPNNLILSRDRTAKVIDYGLAWVKGEEKGRVQGTPEYMAPETARDKLVSERSDVYNLGATMYRLVTGHLPPCAVPQPGALAATAKTWKALLRPVAMYAPTAPKGLSDLIHRCLEYDPHRRPERMSVVQEELDGLAGELASVPG